MAPFLSETTGLELVFRHHFGVPLAKFADKLTGLALNKFVFDVIAFDDWLAKKHPEYDNRLCILGEKTGVSTSDAIKLLYSEEAEELIRKLIRI